MPDQITDLGFVPDTHDLGFVPDAPVASAQSAPSMYPPRLGAEGGLLAGMVPGQPIPGAQAAKGAGLMSGYAYAGGVLGSAIAPGPGTAIGMGLGGMLGNVLHQETSPGYNVNQPGTIAGVRPGEALASGVLSGVPMGNLEAAGVLQFLKQSGKLAATGIGADQLQKAIDETRLLKPGEVVSDATMGILAAAGMKLVDSGSGAAAGKAARAEWAAKNPALSKLAPELSEMGATIPAHVTNPEGVKGMTKFAGSTGPKDTGVDTINKLAAVNNQDWANTVAKRVIDVPEASALTPDVFDAAITKASEPYAKIAAISPKAAQDLQDLRENLSNGYKAKFAYDNPTPGHFDASLKRQSEAFYNKADELMDSLEKQAKAVGAEAAIAALPEARVKLAQISKVAQSTNQITGAVNLQALQKLRKNPLDFNDYAPPGQPKPRGDLARLADAGEAFPQLFPSKVGKIPEPTAPAFKMGVGGGGIGLLAGHPEAGAMAGYAAGKAIPLLKEAARTHILTPEYILRNRFAFPDQGPADPIAMFMKNAIMSNQLNPPPPQFLNQVAQ